MVQAGQGPIQIAVLPCDAAFETTPTISELGLLACPDGAGYRIEALAVGFSAVTLPVDAANNINGDIEHVDDSDSDTVTNVAAAVTFDDNRTARVYNELWRGSQILDPGDTLNMEFDVTTPTTASEGAVIFVEYRIIDRLSA